jgi:LmbE family N-acetylglucosaminyl deacetylase
MPDKQLRILVFGAHPDDAEVWAGGTMVHFARAGHIVKCVTLTNGDTGHYEIGGVQLARRRQQEAQRSAQIAGIAEYTVLDNHCGELEPTVENRKQVIRILREFRPDLVLTHRPYDYHPDHRYTSQLVLDASYIVTVPNMVPLSDHLPALPRLMYMYDRFTRPVPLKPDVVIPVDDAMDTRLDMLDAHESQMYEWIPYNRGVLDEVPTSATERKEWLGAQRNPVYAEIADKFRDRLVELYGEERGRAVRYAEAFEGCEYGAGYDAEQIRGLFPFVAGDLV